MENTTTTIATENPNELIRQIFFYQHVKTTATYRKSRLEDLMKRRYSNKWDATKKAKMVRRLVTANQELEQSEAALDQLNHRLSQITTQKPQTNNISFSVV